MTEISSSQHQDSNQPAMDQYKSLTRLIYIMQAVSFLFGGIPFLIAVIINFVKRAEVKETWLESHFNWQINTFWYALVLSLIGGLTFTIGIGIFILIGGTFYIVYRIVYGWVQLNANRPVNYPMT